MPTINHLGSILILALLVAIVTAVAAARQLKWKLAAAVAVVWERVRGRLDG